MELEPLWRPAQPLLLSRGAVLDTYLLPIQAAPAYAQHPSAPQARTFGEPPFQPLNILSVCLASQLSSHRVFYLLYLVSAICPSM